MKLLFIDIETQSHCICFTIRKVTIKWRKFSISKKILCNTCKENDLSLCDIPNSRIEEISI